MLVELPERFNSLTEKENLSSFDLLKVTLKTGRSKEEMEARDMAIKSFNSFALPIVESIASVRNELTSRARNDAIKQLHQNRVKEEISSSILQNAQRRKRNRSIFRRRNTQRISNEDAIESEEEEWEEQEGVIEIEDPKMQPALNDNISNEEEFECLFSETREEPESSSRLVTSSSATKPTPARKRKKVKSKSDTTKPVTTSEAIMKMADTEKYKAETERLKVEIEIAKLRDAGINIPSRNP